MVKEKLSKILLVIPLFYFLGNGQVLAEDGPESIIAEGGVVVTTPAPTPTATPEAEEAEPFIIEGRFTGRNIPVASATIPGIQPLAGGYIPAPSEYQNGNVIVGGVIATPSETGGSAMYEVTIYSEGKDDELGPVVGTTFAMTEAQIDRFIQNASASMASTILESVVNRRFPEAVECDQLGGQGPEEEYRRRVQEQRDASLSGGETYERGTRSPSSASPSYESEVDFESAAFASGTSIAVGNGTGLINRRENDPNAGNETPGCEAIGASAEERESNPDLEMNEETLTRCITAIQSYILQGVSQPPQASDRALVFRRLFDLPNHEQEFASAIFTLDGEVGHHSRENPMEGVMVLKVLSNRRDNANGVEDALQQCRDNHSDAAERSACFGEANRNSTFNLLDVALDNVQFSMYNSGEGGNWRNKFGTQSAGQFRDSINAFLKYEEMEEFTISGPGSSRNPSIHKIYHYHTPAVRPDWRDDSAILSISGTNAQDGEYPGTRAHVFYYNHDSGGASSGDGWYRNVRHEFRNFTGE